MKNPKYRTLARILEDVRAARGQSMEQAAVAIGTSRQTYDSWVKGKTAPTHVKWTFAIHEWAGGLVEWDEVYDAVARQYATTMSLPFPGYLSRRAFGVAHPHLTGLSRSRSPHAILAAA